MRCESRHGDQTRDESQEVLADVPYTGDALCDAQQVACATMALVIKATLVRSSSSPRNRLVRTRMLGGVGVGTGNRPGYPFSATIPCGCEFG